MQQLCLSVWTWDVVESGKLELISSVDTSLFPCSCLYIVVIWSTTCVFCDAVAYCILIMILDGSSQKLILKKFNWLVVFLYLFWRITCCIVCFTCNKWLSNTRSADVNPAWLTDPGLRSSWVKDKVAQVLKGNLDGVNVDFEGVINSTDQEHRDGLTSLVAELVSTLKKISPNYQVSKCDCSWCHSSDAAADVKPILLFDELK